MSSTELMAAARLDLGEIWRSRWLALCVGVYALLAAVFVLVGMHESQLTGFTGMGRVLFAVSHALVLVLPLLALLATGQVVNRAREDGTLELLFSHPLSRRGYFVAVSATRLGALAVPLLVLLFALPVFGRVAFGQEMAWAFVARAAVVSASLLMAFVGIGLSLSTAVRNPGKAIVFVLLIWAAAVAVLDFGLVALMLRWRLNPRLVFLLAALNPVQAARLALLSGAEPELSTLGPVGFWMSTTLGPKALFALGVAWPAALGLGAWAAGLRKFCKGDLV